jgi:glutamyl-tRNA synthetase
MEITQVIRGDDHINNTPRQINMYQAMGWSVPEFAHLPMILGDDGARLSKRHGAVSVMQYADEGYLPEGLLNYLVRLGWSHGDQELFSREEMIQLFELANVNRAPSAFNTEKLNWLNAHYIKAASPADLAPLLQKHLQALDIEATDLAVLAQIVEAQRERASTLVELAEISAFYFNDPEGYRSKPAKKALVDDAITPLTHAREALAQLASWEREPIHQCVADAVAALEIGFGKLAMPLRISVTDGAPSPDLDLTLFLVGREATLRRIDNAIAFIQENAS